MRRGTFVGTVNYLAPEMIKDSVATCATDLWALGCIIFKMLTGKVPFPGMSETAVFPSILNRQIDWPKDFVFDKDVKDLIDQLLQVEPFERLGCPGTGHDIYKLMRHPFFKGIDFAKPLNKTLNPRQALLDQEN